MTPERWKQIKSVFEAALDVAPPQRGSFIDQRCGADAELRSEVVSLLEAHENTGGFLEDLSNAAAPLLDEMESLEDTAPVGMRVGPWELQKEIGRGGMGAVYLAHRADSEFRKRVAVKLIRHGMESPFAIRRFRNERQILATLEHPNIARLIDGGTTTSGLPYLVMELVEGEPLLEYCETRALSITERLDIFKKVCSAVHYAHRRMIIHRDLKPANVLVKKDGTPKLLDFGVAKLVDPDSTEFGIETTLVGVRMVTPAYASPEQMRGEAATPVSDIYSLGVILSELVAGCKPSALAASAAGTLHTPARTDIHPSRVGDLRNIILHAAQAEPAERYASVEDMIADLDRYTSGLPVTSYTAPRPAGTRSGSELPAAVLAVLPFRLMDRQTSSDAYLATGITDAIITRISAVARISVRPTSAVLRYADAADAVASGYELNVEYVLEGTLQRHGTRVRATVQLVRVRDASPVWAASFQAESADLLQLEDSIASQVAEAVMPHLTLAEREQLVRRGTSNPKAHEAYLRGRHHWNKYTTVDLARALLFFTLAVEQDPDYAQAHSGIADYYNLLGIWGGPPPTESFAAAKVAAEKALAINPMLAEAHASYAFAVWCLQGDTESAGHHFHMAITLNPDYAVAHLGLGMLHLARGRLEAAIASLERSRNLAPHSPVMASALARAHRSRGECQRAVDELLDPARSTGEHYAIQEQLAWAYLGLGRVPDAFEAANRAVELSERAPASLAVLAQAEAAGGNRHGAQKILDEALARAKDTFFPSYSLATIYLAAGRRSDAIRELARARADRDFWSLFAADDPRWDSIRNAKAFRDLSFIVPKPLPGSVVTTAPLPARARKHIVAAAVIGMVAAAAAWFTFSRFQEVHPAFEQTRITKLTTNGTAIRAAISEDGKLVAYTGTQDGQLGVWVRRVDEPGARKISGPVQGDLTALQFSGGGAYVSFISYPRNEPGDGTLYRIPTAGGAAERLMSGVPGPAALSRDGMHLAYLRPDPKNSADELVIANPDGSGARTVVARRYPDRFTWSSGPSWSDDDSRIALAAEGTDANGFYTAIMGVDVNTGATHLVPRPRFQYLERIAWVHGASGLVAIGQEQDSSFQQIWYIPYPNGDPKRIGSDLNDYSGISAAGDGRSLVSVQTQTLSNVYVLDPDKRSRQITPGSGRYFDLAWTPEGRLVYASDASGSADVWIMNADGTGQHQLTSGKGRSYAPAVSPDHKYVAYHSNRTGAWNIWRMGIDGSNPTMLTNDTRDSNWPQFTPDGRFIVYHHTEPNAIFTLWKIPAEGGTPVRLTNKLSMRPAVARDGRIACWFSEQSGSPNWKLAVLPPAGGSPIGLFDPPPGGSPDTHLRWNSRADAITLVVSRNGVSNLYEQPVSGGPARPLTRFTSGQIYSCDWSRSGQLAYSRGISSSDVVLVRDARNE